jgi:DNA-binding FrmR family transcriptional regulator
MYEFEYDKDFFNHLHRLIGQLQSIEKMIHDHRSPDDINIQFSAAEKSLHTLFHEKFFTALQKNDASLLSQFMDKYSNSKWIRETLENIRKNFASLSIFQLIFYFHLLCGFDENNIENED